MMTTLFFVRHGQAEVDLGNTVEEGFDSPLTARGKEQLNTSRWTLRGQWEGSSPFVALYCSPYRRARETAQLARKLMSGTWYDTHEASYGLKYRRTPRQDGLQPPEVEIDPRLSERDFGNLVGRRLEQREYEWLWSYDYICPDPNDPATSRGYTAEDLYAMEARIESFLEDMRERHAGKTVLAVSHGGVARVMEAVLFGRPKSRRLEDIPAMRNGDVRIFEI